MLTLEFSENGILMYINPNHPGLDFKYYWL